MKRSLHPFMRLAFTTSEDASDSQILERLHARCGKYIGNGRLLGIGGEGLVYSNDGWVHKFLLNWTVPRRDPDQTHHDLSVLAERIGAAQHLYSFVVKRPEADLLHISYEAKAARSLPSSPARLQRAWGQGLSKQLQSLMEELVERGYFHTNLTPSNVAFDDGILKLIDYGSDCRPLSAATLELGRIYFMKKASIRYNAAKEGVV